MPEISDFALILLPIAGGLVLAILSSKLSERLPIPAPGVFLLVAAVVSHFWTGIGDALTVQTVERIAVVALVVILLNGGMDIGWRRMRGAAGPVLSLGVLGTFASAGLLAVVAHVLLGFSWTLAGILGAALAPTDPAVVFSVLGGADVGSRAGTVLEGEAGMNDPAGIALMIGMIELATSEGASFLVVVEEFLLEMSLGLVFGLIAARGLLALTNRIRLATENLRPVFLIALAMVLYAVTSVAGGSGFLAVFVAGLLLGDADIPAKADLERFNESLAGLAEIVVFVALGLTVDISSLPATTWRDGAVLILFLGLLIRPFVVLATTIGAGLSRGELVFVAWSGLKGAVPILLAAFAVLGGVDDAESIYGVVFVAVLISVFGQGSLVPALARRLERRAS